MTICLGSPRISEIWKAMQYCNEPDRIRRNGQGWILRGNHREHHLVQENGLWACDCEKWAKYGACCHTITMEHLNVEAGQAWACAPAG